MKIKQIAFIALIALIIPSILFFTSCKKKKKDDNGAQDNTYSMSTKEIYALSAMSGATYFSSSASSTPIETSTNNDAIQTILTNGIGLIAPDGIDADIDNIAKYTKMFENYLLNNSIVVSSADVEATDNASAVELGYNIKLTISQGKNILYTMYYKEKAIEAGDGYDIDDEIDEDDDEVEVSTSLQGLIVYNETEYAFTGTRELETEDGETELSFEFEIKSSDDANDYIIIEQEFESDEQEFEISIYQDNVLSTKTEVEFEVDDGRYEMELCFINGTERSNNSYKLVYKDDQTISVEYKTSSTKGNFTIGVFADKYTFSFDNGYTENVDK